MQDADKLRQRLIDRQTARGEHFEHRPMFYHCTHLLVHAFFYIMFHLNIGYDNDDA